jgi:hypothetical protein
MHLITDNCSTPRFRQKNTLAELEAHEAYQNWRTTNKTQSLVVRGRTNSNTTPLSRLSPVALELGDRLRGEESNDVVIASYFCRRAEMTDREPMHTAISAIICQLLAARPSLLKDTSLFENWDTRLKSNEWHAPQIEAACDLLVEVLSHLDKVYLILDRPETCRGGDPGISTVLEKTAQTKFKCILKMFIVVDQDTANGEGESWRESARAGGLDVIDVACQ